MSRDYSEYYERLTSYTQWAGDANIYVKELVEAGFVYTGENDTVFCFKCGATASDWLEEHNPIERHEKLNSACAFLAQRSKNIVGEQKTQHPPPVSLAEHEKNELLYDWVPGTGALPLNIAEHQEATEHATKEPNHRNESVELEIFIAAVFNGNLQEAKNNYDKKNMDLNKKFQVGQTLLYYSSFKGYIEVLEFLLKQGADPMIADDNGNFPIHTACHKGQLKCVEMLLSHRVNVDVLNRKNRTPLHLAVSADQLEVARLLIQRGANVNHRSKNSMSYLYIACCHGNIKMVELLIEHGSIINIPLRNVSNSPLHVAATNGYHKVISLLIQHGAHLECKDEKFSALYTAIHHERLEAVDVLLDAGAKVNFAVPEVKQTALHLTVHKHKTLDYISRLIDHGANLDAVEKSGLTALHFAAIADNVKVAEYLLSRGADPDVLSMKGNSASKCAKSEQMKFLLSSAGQPSQEVNSQPSAPPLEELLSPGESSSKPLESQLKEKEEELKFLQEKTLSVQEEIKTLKERIELQTKVDISCSSDHFECPICLEIPLPPTKIFQCIQGHIFCEVCVDRGLKQCPECRVELKGEFIRNRRLEDVITRMTGNSDVKSL